MELLKSNTTPGSRNLVFTSAGDQSNVRRWLSGRRDFDLWVVYYGSVPKRLYPEADLYLARAGTKFQNLHYCYSQWRGLFERYEAVLVMDDDIVIGASGISRLFQIRRELDLWALQPAFRVAGKISWNITRIQTDALLRYTSFIEMTCPLFRRDKLDAFMDVFDPELMGYGEDWWFLQTLGAQSRRRVAIADEVPCINPHDRDKGGAREIDRLSTHEQRKEAWDRIKARYGLHEMGRLHEEYGRIERSGLQAALATARFLPEAMCDRAKQTVRRWRT
jgi:hypothetical protein